MRTYNFTVAGVSYTITASTFSEARAKLVEQLAA